MILLKSNLAEYERQDKYSQLMLLYILNVLPELYANKKDCFTFSKEDICDKFKISKRTLDDEKCIEGLKKIMCLRITFDYKLPDNSMRTYFSSIISSIDYDTKNPGKKCTVTLAKWIPEIFSQTMYIENRFHKGYVDYSPFIKGKNNKTECMNLPQKFIELYRINCNKKNDVVYKVSDYFQEVLSTDKVLRRKFITGVINNINASLIGANIKLEFDCEFTPKKFKSGHFKIVQI